MFHRLFAKQLKPLSLPGGRRPPRRRFEPSIESLEDRTLLSFNAPLTLPTGIDPHGLAAANLTRSGNLDLVVANKGFSDGTFRGLSVLLGNGDGTFQRAGNIDVGPSPFAMAAGDFTGNGILDLVVTHADEERRPGLGRRGHRRGRRQRAPGPRRRHF
jgi:hypothetical protein